MRQNIYRKFYFKLLILFFLFNTSFTYAGKKSAGLAMLLCVLPAGGQFYTERYVPGLAIASTELALGYYAYKYHQDGKYEQRNSLLWWGFFVFGFSLADAYVGAKMYHFDIDADVNKVSFAFRMKW